MWRCSGVSERAARRSQLRFHFSQRGSRADARRRQSRGCTWRTQVHRRRRRRRSSENKRSEEWAEKGELHTDKSGARENEPFDRFGEINGTERRSLSTINRITGNVTTFTQCDSESERSIATWRQAEDLKAVLVHLCAAHARAIGTSPRPAASVLGR